MVWGRSVGTTVTSFSCCHRWALLASFQMSIPIETVSSLHSWHFCCFWQSSSPRHVLIKLSDMQGCKYASISTESFKPPLRHLLAFVLLVKLTLKPRPSTMVIQQFDWRGRYFSHIFVFEAIYLYNDRTCSLQTSTTPRFTHWAFS
jgi:hypothetical protein